jgi:hypothetical protein
VNKSTSEIPDAKPARPYTDKLLPILKDVRILNVEPISTKSSDDIEDANYA